MCRWGQTIDILLPVDAYAREHPEDYERVIDASKSG